MIRGLCLVLAVATALGFDPELECAELDKVGCNAHFECSYDLVQAKCNVRPSVCSQISCDPRLRCPAFFKKVKSGCCFVCKADDGFYKLKDTAETQEVRNIYKYASYRSTHTGELPPENG